MVTIMTMELPPIKTADKPAWVDKLDPENRRVYEEVRASDIAKDESTIMEIFGSFPELSGVPEELLGHLALRFATPMRDCYEEGIQVGSDQAERNFRAERARYHQIEINRLGGWG